MNNFIIYSIIIKYILFNIMYNIEQFIDTYKQFYFFFTSK